MALLCANEDFVLRTLKAVPGMWDKLRYVASLRGSDGRYHHWGLIRAYGESAAHEAICETHRSVLLELLRTPVGDLLSDVERSAAALETPVFSFLGTLSDDVRALLPVSLGGGSARHFNSVLEALVRLVRAGSLSRRRVS
jgi:hypothetical protein